MTKLELSSRGQIGFNGAVKNGLYLLADGDRYIYALGSSLCVAELGNSYRPFVFYEHTQNISVLTVSASGRFAASGTTTHGGFTSEICVWDLMEMKLIHTLSQHKESVIALAFSHDDKHLASYGADNEIVLWEMEDGQAIVGTRIVGGKAIRALSFASTSSSTLVGVGEERMWVFDIDYELRIVKESAVNLGSLVRVYTALLIDADDQWLYSTTETGDLVKVNLKTRVFAASAPQKRPFSGGLHCITTNASGNLIVGSASGKIVLLSKNNLAVLKTEDIEGGITSLAVSPNSPVMLVGTKQCSIFKVDRSTLSADLYLTAPSSRVQGVIFPNGYGRVFASYCKNYISVWGTDTCEELLRIVIPAVDCLSATFSPDGRQIVSGWSDGTIRSFGPQSGKLLFAIPEAHQGGINCLAMSEDSVTLFSGGRDGLLKRWRVTPTSQQLQQVYPEHRGAINRLALSGDGEEVMSAGSDGSVLTWDVKEAVRMVAIRDSTSFVNAVYGADEAHVVTAGSNGMLSWWGATSGAAIRRLDIAEATPLSALCIDKDVLLVGTDDGIVRAIDYDSGETESLRQGHSAAVSGLVFSPEDGLCVSVSEDMGIAIWALVEREEDD